MLNDVKSLVQGLGFIEGSNNTPNAFVVERAFVG
jgi:ferredoxin--NADP+ reductase